MVQLPTLPTTVRLFVFELHHLGDAVMALPFLRSAAARFDVTVVCRPSTATLLSLLIPEIKTLSAAATWGGRLMQAFLLGRKANPDLAVCVWSDARVAMLMRACGARTRVGFPMTDRNYYGSHLGWRQRNLGMGRVLELIGTAFGGPLLTRELHRKSYMQSHLDDWNQVAKALELAPNFALPWFEAEPFAIPPCIQTLRATLPGQRLIVIHPGARLATKRWAIDRFEALLKSALADEAVVIVQPPGEPFPQPQGRFHLLYEPATLADLIGVLRGGDLVVCNDSLAGHLAAALGKQVVTIFGSGNPAWFAPFNNRQLVASDPNCPYKPCIDRCKMPSFICLQALTTKQVAAKLPAR